MEKLEVIFVTTLAVILTLPIIYLVFTGTLALIQYLS